MWFGGRWWNRALLAAVVPVLVAGLLAGAWLVDRWRHDGRALRNVELNGRLIGSLTAEEVRADAADLADAFAITTIEVDLGDDRISTTAAGLGMSLDVEATTAAALQVGRDGSMLAQLGGWVRNLRSHRPVEAVFRFDESVARHALTRGVRVEDRAPVEPQLEFDGDRLRVVAAVPGRSLDVDAIVEALASKVAAGRPGNIASRWVTVPSNPTTADAQRLAAEVQRRTAGGLVVDAAGTQRWIPPKVVWGWIGSTVEDGALQLTVDERAAHAYVEELFVDLVDGSIVPDFDVVDGTPVVGEVIDRRRLCCGAGTAELIGRVVRGEAFGLVELPLRSPSPDESNAAAASLGIQELVGSFTTNHACCQSRVTNIHRIADLIRGVVLEPGERLSINDFVGRRTRENGFVGGGVIEQGRFQNAVGGGISQFATTLFNAAFFAGLDIPTYQSHSIYISRYPYGREATLSYPAPDLVVVNTTDHAALIWTSYTDTSITVDIYSTRHIQVEELEQSSGRVGVCTRVTTPRRRTYPDGQVVVDEFYATYRPSEGLDCSGRPTPDG